jgi:hypothetical protein
MRRADHVRQAEEQHFELRRLDGENTSKAAAGDMAGLDQRVAMRVLVDEFAARAVDDAHALASSSR